MAELPVQQALAEARRLENEAWREKMRKEDIAWRERLRTEDVAWREKLRKEDRAERNAFHAETLQCLARGLAVLASMQNAKPGTPTKELARKAQDFAQWIGDVAGMTDKGT